VIVPDALPINKIDMDQPGGKFTSLLSTPADVGANDVIDSPEMRVVAIRAVVPALLSRSTWLCDADRARRLCLARQQRRRLADSLRAVLEQVLLDVADRADRHTSDQHQHVRRSCGTFSPNSSSIATCTRRLQLDRLATRSSRQLARSFLAAAQSQ
jgi:hypothetical protein